MIQGIGYRRYSLIHNSLLMLASSDMNLTSLTHVNAPMPDSFRAETTTFGMQNLQGNARSPCPKLTTYLHVAARVIPALARSPRVCQRYDRRGIIVTLRNDETSHRRRGTFPRAIARQANVAGCSERDHALASVLRSQVQREADPAKIDCAESRISVFQSSGSKYLSCVAIPHNRMPMRFVFPANDSD
jgi:hypothetical protein